MKQKRCPTCHRLQRRSNPANALYWALLHELEGFKVRGQTFNAEAWHTWAKSKWLGCTDIVLPNGKVMTEPNSTAALDADQFAKYFDAVSAWAGEHGVFLHDREEIA